MTTGLDWSRWAFYLAAGPPFLLSLFLIKSRVAKVVLLLFVLVFVEGVLLTWRPFVFIGFSLSGAMAYAILASLLLQPDVRRNLVSLGVPWAFFLLCGLVASLIGAASPFSNLVTNWLYFQEFYLEGIVFFWIGRTAVKSGSECQKILHWLILFGAGAAVLHYFTLTSGYMFYATRGLADTVSENEAWRYGAAFANPNSLADFYAVVLPIALVCRMGWSRPSQRGGLLLLGAVALMIGSLALTASRGGALVAIAILAVGVFLLPISLRGAIGAITFGAFSLITAYLTVTNVVAGGLDLTLDRFRSHGLHDIRYTVWQKTFALIVQHPFGVGLDPWIYGDTLRMGVNSAHNVYLDIASQIGLLGLVAMLWIVGVTLARVWTGRRSADPHAKTASTAVFLGLVAFLLGGFVEPIYHNGLKFQRIFWLLVGIGSATPLWAGVRSVQRTRGEAGLELLPAADEGELAFPRSRL